MLSPISMLLSKNQPDTSDKTKTTAPEGSIMFKPKTWETLTPFFFISPWILGFLIFTLGPLSFSLLISFYDWPIMGENEFVGLQNYSTMFVHDPLFWESLGVTFKFAGFYVPFNILVSLLLALLLNQNVKGRGIFRVIFYLPSIISGVALVTIWSWVFSHEYGILNYALSFLGIDGPNWLGDPDWSVFSLMIASLWGLGTMMLIFLAGLKSIPQDLYEVASLSGANAVAKFFYITLPLLSPVILFNVITSIITAFNQLTLALLMTNGGPLNSTYFFAIYIYDNAFINFELGYASSNAWVMFLFVLLLSFLVLKTSRQWTHYETK